MKPDYFDLRGKVALVTGGATGIGLGISRGLAEAGATLAICSRRKELCERIALDLAEGIGGAALGFGCDVTVQSEIEYLVKSIRKRFDRIDILVNCAGVGGSEKMIMEMEAPDWDSVLDINLKSPFFMTREVVKTMIERGGGGKIINVGSMAALIAAPRMSAYCASKAGVVHLTKAMAMEWARYNIQVNAILPGYFETPMNKDFFATDRGQENIKHNIPMQRIGKIDDIKGLAILLASPASDFMTAAAILLDGGQSAC